MLRLLGFLLVSTSFLVCVLFTSPPARVWAQKKAEFIQLEEPKADPKKEPAKPEVPLRRSADGFPIPVGAVHRFGNRQMRHADGSSAGVVSPDGKLLATRGQQSVVVWDLQTLNARHVFSENDGGYSYYSAGGGLAFTPDSKGLLMTSSRIIRSGRMNTDVATLWDMETGKKKYGIRGGSTYQSAVWIDAGGKELATFTDYQIIRRYALEDGKALTTTTLPDPMFQRLFLAPRGDLIAGLNNFEVLKVFETATGKERYSCEKAQGLTQLSISHNGKVLVFQDAEFKVQVHDLEQKKERYSLTHPAGNQSGPMVLDREGKTLYFGGSQGQLYRWDLANNKRLPDVGSHSTWTLTALALSPDEKTLYSMGNDRLIRRWDLSGPKQIPLPEGYITRTTLLPVGSNLLIADHAGRLDEWNLRTGQRDRQLHPGGSAGINCMVETPDHRWLIAGTTTQQLKIWDRNDLKKSPQELNLTSDEKKKSNTDHLQRVLVSPDSKRLFCNTEKTGLTAIDLGSMKPVWNLEKPGFFICQDPAGSWIVGGGGNYNPGPVRLNVIDARTGQVARELEVEPIPTDPNNGPVTPWLSDMVFIPGSGLLFTAHYDGTLRLFDVIAGQERKRFGAPARRTGINLACSADGKWIAMSGGDRKISILELASGKEIYGLGNHDSAVTQVAFTPDSRGIVSSADLAPMLWDLKPAELPKLGTADEIWEQLATEDASAAYRLQWALMDHPTLIKHLLREKIKPQDWVFDRKRYEQLIKALDLPRFSVRETAQRELAESLKIPLAWLRESHRIVESAEVRDRLQRVIEQREKQPATQEWRIRRSIQILEQIADAEVRTLLQTWSVANEGSVLATDAAAALGRLR